ncbi:MAG TPA: TonB-dependent receptor [Gemmatimonadaceae bacterium]|nr:TonB-dependent receptor [Gemmatimonadaceae bacterium]
MQNRRRVFLYAFAIVAPCAALAQVPQTKAQRDSAARADSIARTDSIALVQQLEKDLGTQSTDTATSTSGTPRATGGYMNIGFVSLTDAGWSTAKDVQSIENGDHDPHVRGFTIPNAELSLDGAVDPYFKGFSNIVLKIDSAGETGIELEEVYGLTTSLPANLQVKFGQFFAEFGRQNPQHPHAWAFIDQPLVMSQMFGAEGLRSQGLRLSWLLPTSFYTEAMVGVFNAKGGTAYSFNSEESPNIHGGELTDHSVDNAGDLLFVPRITTSFDLSDTQTLVLGASGAFGPNSSGSSANTKLFGIDGYWKWKSPTAEAGFPFLSLQSEVMWRRYDAASRVSVDNPAVTLAPETLKDWGTYAQVLWGIKPRIVAALRGDWTRNDSDASFASDLRANRFRVSPNLTWYPTEFSKFRVQYNFDDRTGIGTDHSLWLQFEFLIGAHAAHKF